MGVSKVLKPRIIGLVGALLCLVATSARAQQAPISCNGLLNEGQVIQLLKAGVADVRVQAFVNKCGVDFAFTQDSEGRLRGAGASESLVRLVHARTDEEQRKRQQETERLTQSAIQEQKKQIEAERLKQSETEEQKNRDVVRISELRRKLGLDISGPPALKPGLSLDEARSQLVSLRAQSNDIETRLKAEYPGLGMQTALTKDIFETNSEFQARQTKVNEEHKVMEDRYRDDLTVLTAEYYRQIDELRSRKYAMPELKVNQFTYDAEQRLLTAVIGGYDYSFYIEPARARVLYEHQTTLKVKGDFLRVDDTRRPLAFAITLVDPQTQEELNGREVTVDIGGRWKATVSEKYTSTVETLSFEFIPSGNSNDLSGTLQTSSAPGEVSPISGLIGGDTFTFTCTVNGTLWRLEGSLLKNEIRFVRRVGDSYSDEFKAERAR
jgi:hypothetical protein